MIAIVAARLRPQPRVLAHWALPGAAAAASGLLVAVLRPEATALVLGAATFLAALAVCPRRWTPVAGMLGLTGFVVVFPPPAMDLISLGPLTDVAVLALAALLLAVLTVVRLPTPMPPLAVVLAGSAFAGFLAVSSLANSRDVVGFGAHWLLWFCAFLLGFSMEPAVRRVLVKGWIAIGVALAVYAIYEHWMRPDSIFVEALLPGYQRSLTVVSGAEQYRSQATMGHPVPLGSFLAATFALVVGSGQRGKLLRSRAFRFVMLALVALAAAYTFARSSWVALLTALLVAELLRRVTARGPNRTVVAAIAALTFVLILPVGEQVVRYVQGSSETVGFRARVSNLRSVPSLFSSSGEEILLGTGAGAGEDFVGTQVRDAPEGTSAVDNQYVTLLLEGGVLGLTAFVTVVVVALHHGIRSARRSPSSDDVVPMLVAASSLLVGMFFFELFYWPATAVPFWCVLGILCRVRRDPEPSVALGQTA